MKGVKLSLTNFGCYRKKEITIPSSGMVLIDGMEGKGKTTLLKALIYVLYGGSGSDFYTFGEKSCKVTLESEKDGKKLRIKRTSSPNSIECVYGEDRYAGDEAQSLIDSLMGMGKEEFKLSSYIPQEKGKSLVFMSSSEQIKVIERLSDSNDRVSLIAKTLKKEAEKRLIDIEASIKTLKGTLKDGKEEMEKHRSVEEVKRDMEKVEKEARVMESQIASIRKERQNMIDNNRSVEGLREKIAEYEQELRNLEKEYADVNREKEECVKVEIDMNNHSLLLEFVSLSKKRDYLLGLVGEVDVEYSEGEVESIYKEYEEVREEYARYLEKKAIYEKTERDRKEYAAAHRKIGRLLKKYSLKADAEMIGCFLEEQRNKALSKIYADIYTCPSCQKSLVLKEGGLSVCEEACQRVEDVSIAAEEKDLSALEKFRDVLIKCGGLSAEKPEIDMERCERAKERKEKYEAYVSGKESREKICKEIQAIEKRLSDICKEKDCTDKFLDRIRRTIKKNERIIEDNKRKDCVLSVLEQNSVSIEKRRKNMEKKLRDAKKNMENMEFYREDLLEKVLEDIKNTEKKILACKKITKRLNSEMVSAVEYLSFLKERERRKKTERKIANLEKEGEENRTLMAGYIEISEICKKARYMSFMGVVEDINSYARYTLERIFTDNPISITLDLVEKNGKHKLSTNITYRDNIYKSIERLSGGEKQKCNIAFFQAVNNIVNSVRRDSPLFPDGLMIFDESFNNLNSNTNTDILRLVKDMNVGKAIYVVSHEAVQGIFDEVVTL